METRQLKPLGGLGNPRTLVKVWGNGSPLVIDTFAELQTRMDLPTENSVIDQRIFRVWREHCALGSGAGAHWAERSAMRSRTGGSRRSTNDPIRGCNGSQRPHLLYRLRPTQADIHNHPPIIADPTPFTLM